MAANMFRRDKQFGLVMAWHSLTEIVEKITKEIAFPWEVILAEVLYKLTDCEAGDVLKALKGYRLPLASDDMLPLGFAVPVICTGENATYTLRTPQETWDFMQQVLNGTENTVVSAGTGQNRSKYFISAKLTELESVTLEDGSNMELILNGLGYLDKSLHESIVFSGTRTVCYNTLMLNFLQRENNWKYRHSKNMTAKVESDIPLIEKVVGFSAIVKATFDAMKRTFRTGRS